MEERYYTPDISEFCVGFKFYAKQKQNDKSTSLAWVRDDNIYPWEITKDNYGEVFEYLHYGDLRESAVVKYLDREDLESLGFEKFGSECYRNSKFEIHKYDDGLDVMILSFDQDVLFNGIIKNKSELAKVLKMIGYEYEH